MEETRFQISRKDIESIFYSQKQTMFKSTEIAKILSENRDFWRLGSSMSVIKFINLLKKANIIQEHRMRFPHRQEIRFALGQVSDFEIIQSLKSKGYFTHFTALLLHGLTLQIPKTVYLNDEQQKKRSPDKRLAQERIDLAFRNACRVSNNIAEFNGKKICLLNGQFTGQKGVTTLEDDKGKELMVSNIERTLIDCVVRPMYAGGVHSVLAAFENAADKVSINKLTATLTELGFAYPYHQAIGFYLERSGVYSEKQMALVERFEMEFDFYLSHKMKEKQYSKRWRIYYPSGM